MRLFSTFIPVLALVAGLFLLTGGAVAADEVAGKTLSPPGQFIQRLGDTALMSLTAKDLPRKTREARVREILRNNFDVPTIARFAMGTYWREATEAERAEYLRLFENMIVDTYTTRFEEYSGQEMKVTAAVSSGEKDVIVSSQIIQKDAPPVSLEWRVRNKGGALKVVDVVVEGVSMSVTQRSDFGAVIQRGGGDIGALLASLRDRQKETAQKKI